MPKMKNSLEGLKSGSELAEDKSLKTDQLTLLSTKQKNEEKLSETQSY
jgi:hypothetical protein